MLVGCGVKDRINIVVSDRLPDPGEILTDPITATRSTEIPSFLSSSDRSRLMR